VSAVSLQVARPLLDRWSPSRSWAHSQSFVRMSSPTDHEQLVLSRLLGRNRMAAPALAATKAAETLLAECARLQAQCEKQQQRADLIEKEHHEMVADMELLRENEANAGVSREHVRSAHTSAAPASTAAMPMLLCYCGCGSRLNTCATCSRRARAKLQCAPARPPQHEQATTPLPRQRSSWPRSSLRRRQKPLT